MTTDQKIAAVQALATALNSRVPLPLNLIGRITASIDNIIDEAWSEPETNIPLEVAMRVVAQAIKADLGYRDGWISNIAMAFKDEVARIKPIGLPSADSDLIHKVANKAANDFICLLIRDLTEPDNDDIKN